LHSTFAEKISSKFKKLFVILASHLTNKISGQTKLVFQQITKKFNEYCPGF